MHRKSIAVGGVGVAALAAATTAFAAFTQTANITLTATKAGAPTGIKAALASSDPAAQGQKPKAAKKVVVTFPRGTKFNLATVKACKLTDKQLQATPPQSCPAASKIGSGTVTANAAPLAPKINAQVTAYVGGPKAITLVVNHASVPGAPVIVLHATVSGSTLTIPVSVPPLAGIQIVLTGLKLNVPTHGKLITAGKCTAKKFGVKVHFVYADGSTFDVTSSSRCS